MTSLVLFIICELILVCLGAELVVHGSARIASRLRMSEFLVGVLIVGFGSSLPELTVSLMGACSSNPDLCVGNIVGSNIFNALAILGLSALLLPLPFSLTNRRFDLPVLILITFLAVVFCLSGMMLSRWEGFVMVVLFLAYVLWTVSEGRSREPLILPPPGHCALLPVVWRSKWRELLLWSCMVILGLAALIIAGSLLVNHCVCLAQRAGLSQRWVAVLILAVGTSLPELCTSLVAARQGMPQMILGNILGSNVFNLLFILGLSSLVRPLAIDGLYLIDWCALALSVLMLYLFSATDRHHLERWQGALLLLLMSLYTLSLLEFTF